MLLDQYYHSLSDTVEAVLLWIVFNIVAVVMDQWTVLAYCDVLVTCLEDKGQQCIYPAMKIFYHQQDIFFVIDKLIIKHCLSSPECEHSWVVLLADPDCSQPN